MISVIIPLYNAAQTIELTLSSLERNKLDAFEVIVVDDGSTDNGYDVVCEYIKNSKMTINLIKQSNHGVSSARNVGIKAARGEYMLFLDADDLLADLYLDCLNNILSCSHYDTIASFRTTNIKKLSSFKSISTQKIVSPSELLTEYTYSKKRLGFTSFVYKKTALIDKHILFKEGAKYGEDIEFATKYLANCKTALLLNSYSYYYRFANTSASRTATYRQTDVIDSAMRASFYLKEMKHPFFDEFDNYMVPRAIFSCAHRFARMRDVSLLNLLCKDYDVKGSMNKLYKNRKVDFLSRFAAWLFLRNRRLFILASNF